MIKLENSKQKIKLVQLREVKPSPVSFRTIRYSKKQKMQGINLEFYPNYRSKTSTYLNCLGGESFLEDSLMVLLEHPQEVIEYLPQAIPILDNEEAKKLEFKIQNGGIIKWTPDMSSIWSSENPIIFEVKSLSWIENLTPEKKRQVFSKWEQAKQFAEAKNYEFMVFTNSFAQKSWRIENLRDIESQKRFTNSIVEDKILSLFDELTQKYQTVNLIQKQLGHEGFEKSQITGAICNLIYNQELYINLEQEFSFKKTEIRKTSEHVKEIPLRKWLRKYEFTWDLDSIKTISSTNNTHIINSPDLTEYQKSMEEKNHSIIDDIAKGEDYKEIIKSHEISYGKYHALRTLYLKQKSGQIPDYEYKNALIPQKPAGRAKEKLFRINADGNVKFFDKIFEETILNCVEQRNRMNLEDSWRYYKRFKRLDAYHQGLTPRTNETIKNLRIIARKNPGFSHTTHHIFITEYKRYMEKFYNQILPKREGLKQGKKETMVTISSTPYTNYIGQMVQIDHTPADIINSVSLPVTIFLENQDIETGKKVKRYYMERPIITVLEDIHTGVILAYMFRYRKPSIETDFQCIRRMMIGNINPFYDLINENQENQIETMRKESTVAKILRGLHELFIDGYFTEEQYFELQHEFDPEYPDNLREIAEWWDTIRVIPYLLHMDNGRDFTSKQMKNFLQKYKINAGYRPVGGSQYGGHVERVLGTLNRQAFHPMTGNTKENPRSRKTYPSEKMAILTFEQLESLLLLAILRYHATPHSKDHISPREKWRKAIDYQGHNCHFLPMGKLRQLNSTDYNKLRQIAWDLIPYKELKYNRKDGLTLNNIKYNDLELQKFVNDKERITIKYLRSDIRYIFWWHPAKKCPYLIWAKKLRLGNRNYNNNQLRRLHPISDLQYRDMKNLEIVSMGLDLSEKYERLANSAENIHFSIYDALPKKAKRIQASSQDIARKIESGRIEELEVKEITSYLKHNDINQKFQENEIQTHQTNTTTNNSNNKSKSTPKENTSWSQPVLVKTINIPKKEANPFSNKIIKQKK